MNRPSILHVGGILYWTIRTRNPDTQVLKDADSTPTVSILKNGTAVGDSVTVTKRSATTGIYDCSYNPASEVEGDDFTVEETVVITGTSTSQATYSNSWQFTVLALERGTDGAPTASANATAVRSELATELARLDANVSSRLAAASYSTPPTAAANADAVWDEAMSGHTSNGTYGAHFVRSANHNQNTVQITGSQHIAADMHESQVGAIHATTFDAGAITSTVLATDCITSDELAASAIAEIAAAASVTVNVTPLQAVVNQLVNGTRVETFIGFTGTVGPITVTDTNNNPVNLSAPCEIIISKKWRGDILVIPDGSITRSGASNNQFSFSASGATLIPGEHAWALRRLSDNYVFAYGDWIVKQAAKKD